MMQHALALDTGYSKVNIAWLPHWSMWKLVCLPRCAVLARQRLESLSDHMFCMVILSRDRHQKLILTHTPLVHQVLGSLIIEPPSACKLSAVLKCNCSRWFYFGVDVWRLSYSNNMSCGCEQTMRDNGKVWCHWQQYRPQVSQTLHRKTFLCRQTDLPWWGVEWQLSWNPEWELLHGNSHVQIASKDLIYLLICDVVSCWFHLDYFVRLGLNVALLSALPGFPGACALSFLVLLGILPW
jgi:hypothetical protein